MDSHQCVFIIRVVFNERGGDEYSVLSISEKYFEIQNPIKCCMGTSWFAAKCAP